MNKGHCVHSLGVKHEGTVSTIIIIFFFLYLNNIFMSICTSHFVWCNIDKIEFFFLDIQNFKKKLFLCLFHSNTHYLIIYL